MGTCWILLDFLTYFHSTKCHNGLSFASLCHYIDPSLQQKAKFQIHKNYIFFKDVQERIIQLFNDTIQKSEEKLSDRIICYPQTVPHTTVFFFLFNSSYLSPKGHLFWKATLRMLLTSVFKSAFS